MVNFQIRRVQIKVMKIAVSVLKFAAAVDLKSFILYLGFSFVCFFVCFSSLFVFSLFSVFLFICLWHIVVCLYFSL